MASALTAALITACGSGGEETSGESAEETTAEETSGEESEEASDGYVSAEDAVAAAKRGIHMCWMSENGEIM